MRRGLLSTGRLQTHSDSVNAGSTHPGNIEKTKDKGVPAVRTFPGPVSSYGDYSQPPVSSCGDCSQPPVSFQEAFVGSSHTLLNLENGVPSLAVLGQI